MISKATLSFLRDIRKNNDREWFEKNKNRYLSAKNNITEIAEELIRSLCTIDKKFIGLTSKECIFRIYRDVRFSKDKRPYKYNLSADFTIGGRKSANAGYYLHIEPGKSFLAGGIWMPPGDILKKVRQEIDYNGKQFHKILDQKDFKKYFGRMDEENKLKTTPKGYDKDHPDIEILKLTSFLVWHDYKDSEITNKKFVKEVTKGMKLMKPFLDFLNVAISD
jgi:uncharacterized protein (TIGR02453 family)